jgi:catechol 2,3-dioxygenase-like lactoylglutathione lyase family enzyme
MRRRWVGTAALAVLCAGLAGRVAQPQEITGIAHVALRASDLDGEVSFLGKLGFEESFTNVEEGKILQVFVKINDLQFIEVYPRTDPSQPLGILHVCYEADDLKGLNKLYAQHGLKPTAVETAAAGNLLFSLHDPDGNTIELTQYLPDSRQMQDRGNHVGVQRVADELMGLEQPIRDMTAAKNFYATLGLNELPENGNLRLSIAANPDVRVELHPARTGDAAELLFPVEDARSTTDELRRAKVKVVRDNKLVFVKDPDGNNFVFLQTSMADSGQHGLGNLVPWRHK